MRTDWEKEVEKVIERGEREQAALRKVMGDEIDERGCLSD